MIRFTQGNLLEAEALVNTVNTVGVSGKGIALMFKEAFPENFRAYEAASKAGKVAPGGAVHHRAPRHARPAIHHQLRHQAALASPFQAGLD